MHGPRSLGAATNSAYLAVFVACLILATSPFAAMDTSGLEAVFLASRDALLRFLRAHGAGEAAEDLLHELWIRVRAARPGPIANPLSYLYRAANNLIVDRVRSERQAASRDKAWTDASSEPAGEAQGERMLIAREQVARAAAALAELGPRVETVFRRHRLDGVPQRALAEELGVSLSTIESDLRRAAQALIALRRSFDED